MVKTNKEKVMGQSYYQFQSIAEKRWQPHRPEREREIEEKKERRKRE